MINVSERTLSASFRENQWLELISSTELKIQTQSKLHQARSADDTRDSSEIRAVNVGYGIVEINRVEKIENFRAEFEIHRFSDPRAF